MAAGQLTARERKALRTVVSSTRDAKPLRQAQALLALDAGEKAKRVAQRVGINRSTVFQWRREFIDRRGEPVAGRLGDRPRSGRPRTAREVATKHVSGLMDASQEFGYRHTVRTFASGSRQVRLLVFSCHGENRNQRERLQRIPAVDVR